jgi:hypothetical protein
MTCNNKPLLDEVDGGSARRLIDFPFRSLFVKQEDLDKYPCENIYPKNPDYLNLEFWKKYRCALFKYLLRYKNNGEFQIPEEIIKRNQEYLGDSDYIQVWFNENYEQTSNKDDFIKLADVFDNFKCSDYYVNLDKKGKRNLTKSTFIKNISIHYFYRRFYKEQFRPTINGKQECYYNILNYFKLKKV